MHGTGTLTRRLANANATEVMKRHLTEIQGMSTQHKTTNKDSRWSHQSLLPNHVRVSLMIVEAGVPISLLRHPSFRR